MTVFLVNWVRWSCMDFYLHLFQNRNLGNKQRSSKGMDIFLTNIVKAAKKTEPPAWPYPFLIDHWTPEGGTDGPFIPAFHHL